MYAGGHGLIAGFRQNKFSLQIATSEVDKLPSDIKINLLLAMGGK